jgi:nucleotide-binding universal stress UspA family protein
MVTYLIGTDGVPASETVCDYLEGKATSDDHLEVVHVQESTEPDDALAGRKALEVFEDRFEDRVSVTTHQVNRGRAPSEELVEMAEEVDADEMLTALRRHSRTERIIFGSVSQALLQRVTLPITLVPLPEYQAPNS